MFLKKTVVFVFTGISMLMCCSCHKKQIITSPPHFDTAQFYGCKKNYDSLYMLYESTKEIAYLQQAGLFADSILSQEDRVLSDSSLRQVFLSFLYYRGLDLNDLENYYKSRELLEKYILMSAQYKSVKPEEHAYTLVTLGNIYSRYGDYKKAQLLLQQSLDFYSGSKMAEYISSNVLNLSIPLKELRRYDEAANTLNMIFTLSIGPKRKAKACIELADISTRQDNPAEAGIQLKKAKEYLAAMPTGADRTDVFSLFYQVEGKWLMALHKPAEALKAYKQSFDSAIIVKQQLRNRDLGKLYIAMGNTMETMQLFDSALKFYNRGLYSVTDIDTLDQYALPRQQNLYTENTIAEALYARAGCITKMPKAGTRQLEHAVNCFKLAFETERKLLNAFSYDESRQFMQEQTRLQTEKAIGLCYNLYSQTGNNHWANEAFLFAENNKAFVLAESVRRNTAASVLLQNDSGWLKTQQLKKELAFLEIEISKQHLLAKPDTAFIKPLLAKKQTTEEQLLAAENNTRIKNPQYARMLEEESDGTAEEILQKLKSPGGRLAEYFVGDTSAYLFAAGDNKLIRFFKLPARIKNQVSDLLQYFSDRNKILLNPAGYAMVAYQVYQSILGPYITLDKNPLLIIPDGFISLVPFDALLTSPVNSTDIALLPYLVRQQETYYAFSCRTLIEQERNKNITGSKKILAFAPGFAHNERGFAPLPQSGKELDAIKKLYPDGNYAVAGNATLDHFISASSNAGIIHLSTHAGSGDSTTLAGIEFFDSSLYLNSIYSMRLKAALVVLSGCETGTGAINKTEGLMSIARGFSYAGTKNVIGSLWRAEDNTSADIFSSFYGGLADNNFSTALHKSKLAVLNNSTVASASPYFWSGYVYIGSYDAGYKTGESRKILIIVFITGLAVLLILLFLKKKKDQSGSLPSNSSALLK